MLRRVEKLFKSIYNIYSKSQKETESPNFGAWFLHSEDYRKLNLTTMPEAIDLLFNKEIDYHG